MAMTQPVLQLSDEERAMLEGERGGALQFAMQLVLHSSRISGAERLLEIQFMHIDACHYYGRAHVDFARFMVEKGAKFNIPAWTNTITVSLIDDDPRAGADRVASEEARELAQLYIEMGAKPVWTCAPYQLPGGPAFGDHIAVGESNAVSYYNSIVGARTCKYGDFLDVACGLIGRVPDAGLHRSENRRANLQIDVGKLPEKLRQSELFCHVLGYHVGRIAGEHVPVITGLPKGTDKDSLKAIAAGAAASGGVELFHAVGSTPEAPDLETAAGGKDIPMRIDVAAADIIASRQALSTASEGALDMVALGTPHFSFSEFERLTAMLRGRHIASGLLMYVSTSRFVKSLIEERGWMAELERAGVTVLVDTCTYFSPAVRGCRGRVMTNSSKWAYYAPGMLPVEVVFGSLEDCVESAVKGAAVRDPGVWSDQFWGQS